MKWLVVLLCAVPGIASAAPDWIPSIHVGAGVEIISRQRSDTHHDVGAHAAAFLARTLSPSVEAVLGAMIDMAAENGCHQDVCGPKLGTTLAAVLGLRVHDGALAATLAVGPASYQVRDTSQGANAGALIVVALGRHVGGGFELELRGSLALLRAADPMDESIHANHADHALQIAGGLGYRFE